MQEHHKQAITNSKTLGIIGGMGPAATVDFMQRIVAATPASDDQDHLRILVDNNPKIPSRIKAIIEKNGESPAPVMQQMAQNLADQGAELLAIPCNTAHFYYDQVAATLPSQARLLNMIELSVQTIRQALPKATKVGLLASTALRITQLYEAPCQRQGLEIIYPTEEDQCMLMTLITQIKANQHKREHIDVYHDIAKHLYQRSADCLLVACTELSVIGMADDIALPVFDALDILVEEILAQALSL